MYDCIIVGGGVAGLSAALALGRSGRRTLVCDSGAPRNAPAHAAHNLFSRDGTPPLELLRIGREQLEPYTSVEVVNLAVVDAEAVDEHFVVTLSDNSQQETKRIILATGMRDILPEIEGLAELWGKSVVHCPYCHGWEELYGKPVAALGKGDAGYHLAVLVSGWSDDVVLCTNGPAELSDEQREILAAVNIKIREEQIERLLTDGEQLEQIVFEGGERLARHGILMHAPQQQRSELAARLGCEFNERGAIVVNNIGLTSVAGVYAAGDATTQMQSLGSAIASGTLAAAGLNNELIFARVEAAYRGVAV